MYRKMMERTPQCLLYCSPRCPLERATTASRTEQSMNCIDSNQVGMLFSRPTSNSPSGRSNAPSPHIYRANLAARPAKVMSTTAMIIVRTIVFVRIASSMKPPSTRSSLYGLWSYTTSSKRTHALPPARPVVMAVNAPSLARSSHPSRTPWPASWGTRLPDDPANFLRFLAPPRTPAAPGRRVAHPLAFLQAPEPFAFHLRVVDEDLLFALVGLYETVTLLFGKPPHRSASHWPWPPLAFSTARTTILHTKSR